MIRSFRSKALEQFWEKGSTKSLKQEFLTRVPLLLSALDAAQSPGDMAIPGSGFHPLKGNRKGRYAVTVTKNWRITFVWDGADAVDVDLEDYH